MNSKFILLFVLVLLYIIPLCAQVPRMLSHQGYLTKTSGTPLDTTLSMNFQLFSDSTGGSSLWNQSFTGVSVAKGIFKVALGPVTLPFNSQYWLEVQAGSETITPRTRLTSAAYALRADTAENVGTLPNLNVTGNVGIGTTNPISKLEVAGIIHSTVNGFKFPDGTTQTTTASQTGTILDYGSSKSVGTSRTPSQIKICYGFGVAVNEGGNKATITGLPFTSSNSYSVIVTRDTGTYASQAMAVNRISGSSFEILDFTFSGTASWIAIGY